jgi:hypothetical protein
LAVNYNAGKIVTDGLVLCLDAANPKSYPGSGTTWTDLSGNGNNGTLVNGVGYSGDNLGSLVFDGVDDGVQLPHNLFWILTPTSKFSLCSWFYAEPTTQAGSMIFSHQNCNNPSIQISVNGTTSLSCRLAGSSGNDFATYTANVTGRWNYVVYTFDGAGNMKLYLNSSLVATQTSIATWSAYSPGHSQVWLGRRAWCGGTNELTGKIASFSYYKDRALTASEIQQNFNATRSRYGI